MNEEINVKTKEEKKQRFIKKAKIVLGGAAIAYVSYKFGKVVCWVDIGNRLAQYNKDGFVQYIVDGKAVSLEEVNEAIKNFYSK